MASSRSSSGIHDGDSVVVNGNFLIDAESNLQPRSEGLDGSSNDGGQAMIARLIAWSARNLMLVLIATAFAVVAGVWALRTLPLDAIPDLSDTQVIVYTEFPGQAPQVVEDQVTYPLTTAMLTVPNSKVVRGFSFFGVSFVYVIFEDGTDIYWARSRASSNTSTPRPNDCRPASPRPWVRTPPASAGSTSTPSWARTSRWPSCARCRTGRSASGCPRPKASPRSPASAASSSSTTSSSIPAACARSAFRLPKCARSSATTTWTSAAARSSLPSTSSWCAAAATSKASTTSRRSSSRSTAARPCCSRTLPASRLGPDERRGIAELNGEGEVASGIALQRFGANALNVIDNVKERLEEIAPSLPEGVEIVPVYDRSELIYRAIDTLKSTLLEESLVVALVCIVFLLHVRSALVAILMLPVGILMSFMAMKLLGIGSNIMSLGGIAIAIGAMIDAAIVMIENAHKHLERAPPDKPRLEILIEAASEVGPALFFSLLIITVSFLPIFTLEAQEGRLFGPLAFTKTFAMAAAAMLSITLVPALMVIFVRGRIIPEPRTR